MLAKRNKEEILLKIKELTNQENFMYFSHRYDQWYFDEFATEKVLEEFKKWLYREDGYKPTKNIKTKEEIV